MSAALNTHDITDETVAIREADRAVLDLDLATAERVFGFVLARKRSQAASDTISTIGAQIRAGLERMAAECTCPTCSAEREAKARAS